MVSILKTIAQFSSASVGTVKMASVSRCSDFENLFTDLLGFKEDLFLRESDHFR